MTQSTIFQKSELFNNFTKIQGIKIHSDRYRARLAYVDSLNLIPQSWNVVWDLFDKFVQHGDSAIPEETQVYINSF